MEYSRTKIARLAGSMYLLLILFGVVSIMYIPSQIIVWDDAAQTVQNIKQNKTLFELGIIFGIFCYLSYLFLALALFQLLKEVNKIHAWIMLILVSVSVPIALSSVISQMDIISLLEEKHYMQAIDEGLLHAKVMLSLDSFNNGIIVAQVFWGLWLFPFGYLVYTSGFLPKFLGVMLMIGCFYYFMASIAQIGFPSYNEGIIDTGLSFCAMIGEFGICLWLLIIGDRSGVFKKKKQQLA